MTVVDKLVILESLLHLKSAVVQQQTAVGNVCDVKNVLLDGATTDTTDTTQAQDGKKSYSMQ